MQISFTVGSPEDAALAMRMLALLAPGDAAAAEPAAPKQRAKRTAAAADPVATYNQLAEQAGAAAIEEIVAEQIATSSAAEVAAIAAPADDRTHDQLVALCKRVAQSLGLGWWRPMLARYGAPNLPALTDDQMRAILADEAAVGVLS